MTSKEALEKIGKYYMYEEGSEFPLNLENEKEYKIIKQDLEILEILKEFLSDGNTGTGWIEININPNHDILDSKEHKEKQLLIKEWLERSK